MSISKRVSKLTGKTTYLVRVFVSENYATGRQKMITKTFKTLKEARDEDARITASQRSGTLVVPRSVTLQAFADEWLATTARQSLKVQTVELYERMFKLYIGPALGQEQLQKLSVKAVKQLLVEMIGKYSRSTVKNAHSTLRSCLRTAMEEELVHRNVAAVAKLPSLQAQLVGEDELSSPTPRQAKAKALEPEQALVFIQACQAHPAGLVLLFAIVTGARPGEYLAVRWSDICWESRTVSFERTLVRPLGGGWKVNSPKTNRSVRKVSLPDQMLSLLAEHKLQQDKARALTGERWQSKVDFVFTTSHGSPLDTRRLNTRVFKRIVKDAGLPEDLTLYSLRHSCASLLFAKGVELKVTSQRLGHSSVTMTADTYVHTTREADQQAGEEIGKALFP
ncbi:MAG: site-specific integrase [Candidatus Eremiobacteraeota bacterium]|nr:site-specific integrase [Candidatus Eremiobacteraeota bacterium]